MQKILIISVCQKKVNKKSEGLKYHFHFLGYYRGHKIIQIEVDTRNEVLAISNEYLLWVEVLKIEGNILKTYLIKNKLLSDIYSTY